MECPYCQTEMKNGSIGAFNLLSFTPHQDKTLKLTKWGMSKNKSSLQIMMGFI